MIKKFKPALTATQAKILADYIKTGRVAHLYPKKRVISLNGFPGIPISDAIIKMAATIKAVN